MGLFNKKGFGKKNTSRSVNNRRKRIDDDFSEYGIEGNKIHNYTRSDGNSYQFTYGKFGERVYIFDTPDGKRIWPDEVEYCPNCDLPMEHDYCDDVWRCNICGYEEDYVPGESCPYVDYDLHEDENEYEDYYDPYQEILEMPDCCKACGGPWPDCEISCKIFDD